MTGVLPTTAGQRPWKQNQSIVRMYDAPVAVAAAASASATPRCRLLTDPTQSAGLLRWVTQVCRLPVFGGASSTTAFVLPTERRNRAVPSRQAAARAAGSATSTPTTRLAKSGRLPATT